MEIEIIVRLWLNNEYSKLLSKILIFIFSDNIL